MNSTPIPLDEKNRLKALRSYQILDTFQGEEEYDRLTKLASIICGMPVSLITLIDENRQWVKSGFGMHIRETAREASICHYTIKQPKLFEVEDTSGDDRFAMLPMVTGEDHIRFYAGYPLIDHNGYALGALCVMDRKPNRLSEEQQEALKMLADTVMSLILERRRNQELHQLEQLFQLSNDMISISSLDGTLLKINPAFQQILGWETHEMLNHNAMDFLHEEDLPKAQQGLAQLSAGEKKQNITRRYRTKAGGYRILQWVANPNLATGEIFAIGRDITEERKREEVLARSQRKLQAFFEHSQGLMSTHDLNGRFISVNIAGASLIGYTMEEVLKLSLYDIIPPGHHAGLTAYLHEIAEKGRCSGQMTTLNKRGQRMIWMFRNILEHDENGVPYVIGNAIDITERYHLEKTLARTKEMLEQTNKVARVGGWVVEMNKNRAYWSDVTKELHGVPPDFEPDLGTALRFVKKGDSHRQVVRALNRAMHEGKSWDMEVQIVTPEGEERWIRSLGNAEFEDGECKRLYGAYQDIDEKKRTEIEISNSRKLLDDVLQAASEVSIIATDKNGQITLFNRGAERLLGYKAEEVIGQFMPTLIHDGEEVSARATELSQETGTLVNGFQVFTLKLEDELSEQREWTYIRKDGTRLAVSLVETAIKDVNDEVLGYLGIATDITRRKQMEQTLIDAKLQAEQMSVAKSEFLANMSHEIRTPLNGVIGFTDLVLKTKLNETQQQYLSIVNQSANVLLSIINDILDFSKIEAGKFELDISRCDLFEMGSEAADIISYQAQKKGLEMLLNISPDLPRFVRADSLRLKQVLVNLLGNAAKFTEKGEIELKIMTLGEVTPDGVTFRFEVRDTGIGIKPEKQEKIFEAFSQEDASTTKRYGGTGIGLAISNKILALMGSHLQLNSAPGKGSTFFFEVTFQTEANDDHEELELPDIKRVLVVDDNEHNRIILRQMLLHKHIESDAAKNGFEALELLAKGTQYDMIMMDYHMPYMNGLETIRKIREHFDGAAEESPVILLHSSSDDETIIKACEQLEISHRLVKPIKMQDLFNTLPRLFRKGTPPPEPAETANDIVESNAQVSVLIVEDNPVNMLLTRTIIERILPQARILEASNGLDAVKICQARSPMPDIILMDIQIPEMNGYEATTFIRKIKTDKHIPIIALTAANISGEREKSKAAGMDDFLSKPVVESSIAAVFRKWLPPVTQTKHFDISVLRTYLGDDRVGEEMLNLIMTEVKRSLAALEEHYSAEHLSGLTSVGHKLYGMAATTGLPGLSAIGREMEYLKSYDKPKVDQLMQQARKEVEIVLELLQAQAGEEANS